LGKSLKNQVVLITGASSGFGADTARLFAGEGCTVILAARRMERLTQLAKEINSSGGRAHAVGLDVCKLSQIDQVLKAILKTFGRVDILFNNAGFGRLDWLEMLDPATDIDTQMDVNLGGLIHVTRAVLPSMLSSRSGTIINMSSVAGLIPAPMYSIYAATKFGVRGFTDALRREVAPFGVHVCGIYPGPAVTEFSQHTGNGKGIRKYIKTPGWIYMTSEYVARAIVSLAKHPRRRLVLPWWMRPLVAFDTLFPALTDWFLKVAFVKRLHHLEP